MSPRTASSGKLEIRVHHAQGIGATTGPQPITLSGVDAAEGRLTLDAEVRGQPGRYATTPTAQGAPREVGPHGRDDVEDFRCFVDLLASVVSEHGQGTMQAILRLKREGLPCHAEVVVQAEEEPPHFENQGDAPTRDTFYEQLAVYGLRLRAFADESQGTIEEFLGKAEMRQAEQDAQYMQRQLVQVWLVFRTEARAQVQASHHEEMAAIAGAPQGLVAQMHQEQAPLQRSLQESKNMLQLENDAADVRAC